MMQKIFRCAFAVALVAAFTSPASAGEVKVTLNQGLVTIIADEAPVSRILAEWARLGQTKIVNGEKMMMVVSLQLVNMPERQALDILLRSASGYMAAERQTPVQGASAFDRIMILPFSRPPAAAAIPTSSSMPQPFNAGARQMIPQPNDPDDGQPVTPPGMGPQTNAPGQQTSPVPGMLPPTSTSQNPNAPTNPFGTKTPMGAPGAAGQQPQTLPRPGFLPAPPGTPNQPVPFGTPTAPGKPPGGGGSGGQSYTPDRD
jgi:hypothetical protein